MTNHIYSQMNPNQQKNLFQWTANVFDISFEFS